MGSPQTSLKRTMVIQRAHLGIEGEFGVTAERRHHIPNVHAYAQASAEAYQRLGWLVYPPYLKTVAGLPGGLEGWRSLHPPGQEARHVVQGFAQQGPYMVDTWFGEPHKSLREKVYIETPAGTSQLTSRFASMVTTMIAVDGASDDRAAEQVAATVTMKGQAVELTAELSAVGADQDRVAESVKAVMADRPGFSRLLVNGSPPSSWPGILVLSIDSSGNRHTSADLSGSGTALPRRTGSGSARSRGGWRRFRSRAATPRRRPTSSAIWFIWPETNPERRGDHAAPVR